MTPIELKEMLSEIKSEIPEITSTICLIDDSDLSDFAGDLTPNNMALVGVIPSYEHLGKIGAFKTLPIFQLDIIEKTDYSAINNDEFVALYERTLKVLFKVRDFVLEKIEDGCYPMLSNIDVTSMTIDPIKKKSQCNGWSMDVLTE
jgi:hypothetical protein